MSDASEMIRQIDETIAATSPAHEPLFIAMSKGELPREGLRAFMREYYHLVDSLPRFVSMVHSHTSDHAMRRALLEVLAALELKAPSIGELWLQTCSAMGLVSSDVRTNVPNLTTETCLSDFEYLCTESTVRGVAALYAWMSRLPMSCKVQQKALEEFYDLRSGPGVQFFNVMKLQSTSHARVLRSILHELLTQNPENATMALHAAESAIAAVRGSYAGTLASI